MASILDLVKHYQHAIEKYPNDEKKILKCIDKLFNLGVTVQHLQETGVGRTVNALRKEPGDVGQAARALVYKWKLMVAAEESDHDEEQTQSTYNGYENGKTPEDTEYDSRQNKSNKYDRYSKKTEEENYSSAQHINGDYSGRKRKYNSSEEEQPHVKRSKNVAYNEGEERYIDVKIKKEHSEMEHDSHSASSHSDYSDSQDSESGEEEKSSQQTSKTKHTDKHHPLSETRHSSSNDDHKSHKKSSSSSGKRQEHTERQSKHSQSESRSTSEKSSKEKSSSSDKHKKEKESHKKEKSEHKSSDKEKRKMEVKEESSDQHRSKSEKHKSSSSSEKHKSHTEKPSSKSEKHSSSHKHRSDKEKHKHSPEKTSDKHKSKEHSSTSKDKHSSSSKEKVKDKSSSSKDKENSHKSDKKHSSSGDISVKENSSRSKSEKDNRKRSSSSSSSSKEKKSHSGSSHSSKSNKSSNSKSKDSPKKKSKKDEDSEDGIDCGSGASFAEALGMISPTKPKKKPIFTKENSQSPNISGSNEDLSPAALLAPSAKLAPLPALEISALPEISPNYKPRPPPRFLPHFTDEDALSAGISSKNQRTKVYSGNKVLGKIPTLYEMCVLILQEHIDALEYTGGVPYEILKPVVDKATPQQLYMLEHFNPYLMEDTDHLWQKFCEKNFRNKKRQEFESWREMFMRCQEEQEHKLKSLAANIKMTQEAKKAPVKQTKMAYVDTVVKPPRSVARKQAQHGTAFAASASPAARVAALAAAPNVLKGGRPAPLAAPAAPAASHSLLKPKKAPLMQKALQFMRGRKR